MDAKAPRPGRNEQCHCGSGRKYKHCCMAKDEASERTARAEARAVVVEEAATSEPVAPVPVRQRGSRPRVTQPWRRGGTSARGFPKRGGPRKVGS